MRKWGRERGKSIMGVPLPEELYTAAFLDRPNRFTVRAWCGGRVVDAFLADPGRLVELLQPGVELYLTRREVPARRTQFDVVLARHGEVLVALDSRLPNKVFAQAVRSGELPEFEGYDRLQPEVRVGDSRLDFLLTAPGKPPCYVEVKSVTLVIDGEGRFPDAPTTRGSRHLQELMGLKARGYRAAVVFLIQREDAGRFAPNEGTDPLFARTLRQAAGLGVEVWAYRCRVDLKEIRLGRRVEVNL
ncbi:MAG: DNA/RNA nuclease SfsA [Thermoanaerobacteraceae bacterium]|nr:DNA/RNA nuclease SfsA [Thermoanaerobacteraceae bacterium]